MKTKPLAIPLKLDISKLRRIKKYRNWKKDVKKEDGYKCVICGATAKLHVHHLRDASHFPKLIFTVSNGVTLCSHHHSIFHTSYKNSYQESCNLKDFKNFIELLKKLKKDGLQLKIKWREGK